MDSEKGKIEKNKSGDAGKGRVGNGNRRARGWELGPLRWLVHFQLINFSIFNYSCWQFKNLVYIDATLEYFIYLIHSPYILSKLIIKTDLCKRHNYQNSSLFT